MILLRTSIITKRSGTCIFKGRGAHTTHPPTKVKLRIWKVKFHRRLHRRLQIVHCQHQDTKVNIKLTNQSHPTIKTLSNPTSTMPSQWRSTQKKITKNHTSTTAVVLDCYAKPWWKQYHPLPSITRSRTTHEKTWHYPQGPWSRPRWTNTLQMNYHKTSHELQRLPRKYTTPKTHDYPQGTWLPPRHVTPPQRWPKQSKEISHTPHNVGLLCELRISLS